MGKSKDTKVKAVADPIKSVKNAGVTKPSKTVDAKSKKLAKEIAAKAVNGKEKKKSKKVEPESESEDSESESESEEESEEESEDESEEEEKAKPAAKTNGKAAKKVETESESESESESGSDSDSASDSDSDEEEVKEAAKPKAEKKKAESDSDSDSGSGSDSDSDSDEEEEKETEEPSKKRKAEDEKPAAAKKAKTENGAEADAEEPVEGTTLFAGNLGWKVDDSVLQEEFKGCEGLIGARVITDREQQRSRGFGYLDFDTPENAKAAFEKMQGYFIEGRELKLDFSTARPKNDGNGNQASDRAKKYGDTISPESDTLFVGNLPFHADEDSVSAFFNEVANVKSMRLPTDMESGRPKGFGYVSFYSVDDARKAFEQLNGKDCAGRNVRLDYSTPKPRNDFGGSGGGRGGGRGGFGGGRGGGGRGGGRGGPRGGGRGGFGGGGRGGGSSFLGKKTTF